MQKRIRRKFFVFEIIVSELVVLNCLYSADNAFSLTANVLTNGLRILCITKRDFFQFIYLHSD